MIDRFAAAQRVRLVYFRAMAMAVVEEAAAASRRCLCRNVAAIVKLHASMIVLCAATILAATAQGQDDGADGSGSAARGMEGAPVAWSEIGGGMNNKVEAVLHVDAPGPLGGVYAGGSFTQAGGQTRKYIARWHGSAWKHVGGGMNGPVKAMVVYNNQLYVAGEFTKAGTVNVNNIARWDGTTWRRAGSGLNGQVRAMAVHNSVLIVGGKFSQAGSVTANNIAKYNGSSWSALGTGMNGAVNAVTSFDGKIYAGGAFSRASGNVVNHLAKWNGSKWVALKQPFMLQGGFGSAKGVNGIVYAMVTDGVNLYIGGAFTTAGGTLVNYIVGWNGSAWFFVGTGTNGTVRTIEVLMFNGTIAVGGSFTEAGGLVSRRVAVFWLGSWIAQPSLNATVLCLLYYNNYLWAGGLFTSAGGTPLGRFGRVLP